MKPTTFGLFSIALSALLAAPAPAQDRGRGQTPPPKQERGQQGGRGGEQGGQRGGQRGGEQGGQRGGERANQGNAPQGRVVEGSRAGAQRVGDARMAQTDEALRQLETRGAQASAEDLDRLSQALRQSLGDARGRERIQNAISELQERARQGKLTEADVRALRTETYDARFDQAFGELMQKAQARQASPEEFDQLASLMIARQQAAQGTDLDLRTHQARLQQAIDSLKQKYASNSLTPAEWSQARANWTNARLDLAFDRLAQQAAAGTSSRADFARVRDLLQARAESTTDDPQLAASSKRLQAAIDQLEQRARNGESITREEIAQLRTQLDTRAREAGATREGGAGEGAGRGTGTEGGRGGNGRGNGEQRPPQ